MHRIDPPLAIPVVQQEPFWQPVGRLVFAFGQLESQIDWCITALLGGHASPSDPSVAAQIRNICSRIALVEALFRQRTGDANLRAELHRVIEELRAIIKFRNGVLHGPWGTCSESGRAWQKPRAHPVALSPGSFEVTLEAIDDHVGRAAQIGDMLVRLVQLVADERVVAA
jgi:hypothetical protein